MLSFNEEITKLLEIAYQGSDVTRRRRMAFDALHLSAGDTVVDIGCGNGLLTEEIARAVGRSGQVIGIDPSADMRAPAAKRCAGYPSVRIREGTADALPLDDGTADKAVAVQVLEYLSDIPAAIREAFRVLRPGGKLYIKDVFKNEGPLSPRQQEALDIKNEAFVYRTQPISQTLEEQETT